MNPWERQIEQDLTWRETELATLKTLAAGATVGTPRHQALLRALWALLYAHYEGFCKFAWDTFLDHVQSSAPVRSECTEPIARFSLGEHFRRFKGDLSFEGIWRFCTTDFAGLLAQQASFAVRLETQSNLWPDLCRSNSASIGLPHAAVDRQHTRLKTLVSRRNDIAHGQPMVVRSLQDYHEYESAAFDVIYELAEAVVDCLNKGKYLKPKT
ncbi:MAG: MAE_28990/MAE_18760 family HEPN-like nuclease [Candidatus Latescibacterota bacterium]